MATLLGRSNGARAASGVPLIIGQPNAASPGDSTGLAADVEGIAFDVMNTTTGPGHAIGAHTYGSKSAVLGEHFDGGDGVFGASSTPDGFGKGAGVGVAGFSGSGSGVAGHSESGPGVSGGSQSGPGVEGASDSGVGVAGHSPSGPGVEGASDSGIGVQGRSQTGFGVVGVAEGTSEGWGPVGVIGAAAGAGAVGVHGKSDRGCGVNGRSEFGPGVVGEGLGDGPGVRAESRSRTEPYPLDGGLALEVLGTARFSTCGAGTIPKGQNAAFVPNTAVTDVSHITVTLTGNPGQRQLHWVQRDPGVGFTVHLTSGGPKPATGFTYLMVEPGSP